MTITPSFWLSVPAFRWPNNTFFLLSRQSASIRRPLFKQQTDGQLTFRSLTQLHEDKKWQWFHPSYCLWLESCSILLYSLGTIIFSWLTKTSNTSHLVHFRHTGSSQSASIRCLWRPLCAFNSWFHLSWLLIVIWGGGARFQHLSWRMRDEHWQAYQETHMSTSCLLYIVSRLLPNPIRTSSNKFAH